MRARGGGVATRSDRRRAGFARGIGLADGIGHADRTGLARHSSLATYLGLAGSLKCAGRIGAAVLFSGLANAAYAAGSGMPWEAPLQKILDSVQGPVAKVIAVIIIVITGLSLALGDTSGGFRRLIQVVFGLSIAFAATSFFLSFFAFGGGVLVQ